MTRKVHCEKKTKIYIPKTVNPQIISYRVAAESNVQAQNTPGNDIKSIKQQ
jgi:hypothetical protein